MVHVILGIRSSAGKQGLGPDSQGRMDQETAYQRRVKKDRTLEKTINTPTLLI